MNRGQTPTYGARSTEVPDVPGGQTRTAPIGVRPRSEVPSVRGARRGRDARHPGCWLGSDPRSSPTNDRPDRGQTPKYETPQVCESGDPESGVRPRSGRSNHGGVRARSTEVARTGSDPEEDSDPGQTPKKNKKKRRRRRSDPTQTRVRPRGGKLRPQIYNAGVRATSPFATPPPRTHSRPSLTAFPSSGVYLGRPRRSSPLRRPSFARRRLGSW